MDSFLLTLVLVFAVAMGGRDQLLVAFLSQRLGPSIGLLVLAGIVAAASSAIMAFAGSTLASILPPRAGDMLVAFALAAAGIELAWPIRKNALREPTWSLGAIGIVLFARQLGDGARFLVFAFVAAANYPLVAGVGGALGGFAALLLAWIMGDELPAKFPLRFLRLTFSLCLIVAALLIGLNARYAIF